MIEMTYDAWWDEFEPMPNHLISYESHMFETYGEEVEYIYKVDPHFVWTLMDGDDGTAYVVEGRHFVNRIAYFVTRLPWKEGESYDIHVDGSSNTCYECGQDLTEQDQQDYANYCERCYKAQGLGE